MLAATTADAEVRPGKLAFAAGRGSTYAAAVALLGEIRPQLIQASPEEFLAELAVGLPDGERATRLLGRIKTILLASPW